MAQAKKSSKKSSSRSSGPEKAARKRKASVEAGSRGLTPEDLLAAPPADVLALAGHVEDDGGHVLARYPDPLGGHWILLVVLPITRVEPTPFQRDLSATHVDRLRRVIDELDWFLDPLVTVRSDDGRYWTPNGNHRLHAMRALGARAVVALLVSESRIAYRILALNTEKAHNLKEKAIEVIRMARSLAELDPRAEREFALEFEEPALLTLGLCYERRPRFSGSVYHPILKRLDAFGASPLPEAIAEREGRAELVLALDDAVAQAVVGLKERGLESPYLKNYVVARVNHLRFVKGDAPPFEPTVQKMITAAETFDASKVKAEQLSAIGGASDD